MDGGWTGTGNGATGAGRWLDVKQAAAILGISSDAIRKRVARGTIPSRKLPDGSVQVRLDGTDGDQPDGGTEAGRASSDERRRDEMVESLQEQVRYLREILNEERDARRRADMISAQLTQASAALARRVPELQAPPEPLNGHVTAAGGGEGVEPRPANGGAQDGSEPRSWWRRWFGV